MNTRMNARHIRKLHYIGPLILFATIGCNKNDVQKVIENWNKVFAAQKAACETGDRTACQTACRMSRAPEVCTTVSRMIDPNNQEQQAWVKNCPATALEDGRSACEAAAASGLPAVPVEAPLRTPTPIAATPVAQNIVRFERISSRGMLPEVGNPVTTEPDTNGPAYFATSGAGLVRLDENGFSEVEGVPKDLLEVMPGADSALWLLSYNAVYRLRDGKIDSFEAEGRSTGFDRMTIAPNGDLWLTGLYGVSRLSGRTWSLFPKKDLTGEEYATLHSILTDSNGRIWLIGHETIYVFDNGQWRALKVNPDTGNKTMYLGAAAIAANKLYVIGTGGLLQLSGEDWFQLDAGRDFFSANDVQIRGGNLFLAGYNEVRILPLNGPAPVRKLKGDGKDFPLSTIRASAADNLGRLWLSGDAGPAMVDESGNTTLWPMGSVDALSAPVRAIYVVGNGPSKLPPVGPVRTASVIGKMVLNGKPVSRVDIQICPSASPLLKKTPCEGQPFVGTAVSGADGIFRIDNVPLGAVQLAYKQPSDAKWTVPIGSCCTERKADTPYNLGPVDVAKGQTVFMFRNLQ